MTDRFSPAASMKSGTTTIPNTPSLDGTCINDLQSEDRDLASNVQTETCATNSPVDSPRQQDANIPSTWPNQIQQKRIPASAFWLNQNLDNQSLEEMWLDVHWTKEHNRAFLKLYTNICLEGVPGTHRNGHVRAYIFLHPKNIRHLLYTAQPERRPYGPSTISLTFELKVHPGLILPSTYTSFEQKEMDKMNSLKSLAKQSSFTIYACLSTRTLSTHWWDQFSKDVAEQKLEVIETLANVRNLYEGRGGQVIGMDDMPEGLTDQVGAPGLPAYQETDPNIPLTRPAKRKRSHNESPIMEQTAQSPDTEAMMAKQKRRYNESSTMGQTTQSTNTIAMKSKREKSNGGSFMTGQTALSTDSIDRIIRHVDANFANLKREIIKTVETMLIAHEHKILEIVNKVESVEADLPRMIEEEMDAKTGEIEEHVLERISTMPIQTTITFPNHPYL